MQGRAGTVCGRRVPDDAALGAAVVAASAALLAVVAVGLMVPAAVPGLAIGSAAGALMVAQRLGRNTAADPALVGAASAAPLLTLALLLVPGLGVAGMIGVPVAAGVAVGAAMAAARARPAAGSPRACARCGYSLEGLRWSAACPECACPDRI